MKHMKDERGVAFILEIVLVAIVLAAVGVAIYASSHQKKASPTVAVSTPAPTTSKTSAPSNLPTYSYPLGHYSFQYNASWQPDKDYNDLAQKNTKPYADYQISSPGYKLATQGVPVLISGASIAVQVGDTAEPSVESQLSKNELLPSISSNKSSTTVAGYHAIQYDYSYEWVNATATEFIGNGRYYMIQLRYPEAKDKMVNWAEYQEVLKSFLLK